MSIFTEKGVLSYKDKSGDIHRLFPKTYKDCILGMEPVDEHILSTGNPHNATPADIGAVAIVDIATVDEVRTFLCIQDEVPEEFVDEEE